MGIWAGIKHALNSTLGTENFKPLDQIIIGQKRFIASDDILVVKSGEFSGNNIFTKFLKFKAGLDGTLKLEVKATSKGSTLGNISIKIYENGILIDTLFFGINSQTSPITENYILTVNKSNYYEFEEAISSNTTATYDFYVAGTIQDSNYFEEIEV